MKMFDALAQRLVGRARRGPTEEEAQLERRHAEMVESLRRATRQINGAAAKSLDEIEDRIDLADDMMREALEDGGDG